MKVGSDQPRFRAVVRRLAREISGLGLSRRTRGSQSEDGAGLVLVTEARGFLAGLGTDIEREADRV
jgi:hypothetical protein